MSSSQPLKLTTQVTRTYTTGLRFEGNNRKDRRNNELQANTIICELQQQIRKKITEEKVDSTLDIVRQQQQPQLQGTKGAAVLAKKYKDRSNLGQVAYLTLLNAAKGAIDREKKVATFIKRLQQEPSAAIEWLVFGRSPYLEWTLQHQLYIAYDYSRNLIHSARRTVDKYLPEHYQLVSPLPSLSNTSLITAIEQYHKMIKDRFDLQQKLSPRQKQYAKKLATIYNHRLLFAEALSHWINDWNNGRSLNTSRWRFLKQFTLGVEEWLELEEDKKDKKDKKVKKVKKHSYLSTIRGILVHALVPYFNNGTAVNELIDHGILRPEHMVARPFREEKKINQNKKKLIPLSLLMGSKYVVGRPGSSTVMTSLAKTKGSFTITIWPPYHRKKALSAIIRFSKKLRQYLANGARLQLLVLRSSPAPSNKLLVDVVFTGECRMFLSTAFLKNNSLEFTLPLSGSPALGIDVNRIGPYVLAFSEHTTLPAGLTTVMNRYLHLEKVLPSLYRCFARWKNLYDRRPSSFRQRRVLKFSRELSFVYARRKRLLSEIHRQCSQLIAHVVFQTGSSLLAIEDLHLSARGTRGALAKTILSMPDGVDLFTRALLLVEHFSGYCVTLRSVNPAYTSTGPHVGCPSSSAGHLTRSSSSYDFVLCPSCDSLVNTHFNAACLIRDRALSPPLPD